MVLTGYLVISCARGLRYALWRKHMLKELCLGMSYVLLAVRGFKVHESIIYFK